ncbi:MAG: efflux RND transporter periplasmic adaptor subunit, partial [Alphaproteobacteria bacterium]|nr:efflux RND transporter periplasmic adaptor subunit [Alphaproteobacteria bacterium]
MIPVRSVKFPVFLSLLTLLSSPLAVFAQQSGAPQGGAPAGGTAQRVVPVLLGAAKREAVPVQFETIGTVQPVASVTLRPRVEGQILEILFADGALVKAGDVLVRLDSRGIDAQVRQAEATVQRTTAQLEQAQRDVSRNEALAANEFASKVNLENAKTQVAAITAQLTSDRAALDNLRVTQSYYTIS